MTRDLTFADLEHLPDGAVVLVTAPVEDFDQSESSRQSVWMKTWDRWVMTGYEEDFPLPLCSPCDTVLLLWPREEQ